MISDKPGQPGEPTIIDYDNTSVTLSWNQPLSDGGSPITHYKIQKKLKGKIDWEECGETCSTDADNPLAFKVSNIIIQKHYKYMKGASQVKTILLSKFKL